jgi:hypothetical protein
MQSGQKRQGSAFCILHSAFARRGLLEISASLDRAKNRSAMPTQMRPARRVWSEPAGIPPVPPAGKEPASAGSRTARAAACRKARVRSAALRRAPYRLARQAAAGAGCERAVQRRAEWTSAAARALASAPRRS